VRVKHNEHVSGTACSWSGHEHAIEPPAVPISSRDEIGETGPAEAEGAAPIGIWKPAYMTLSDVRPDFGRVSGSRTFSPNRPRDNA